MDLRWAFVAAFVADDGSTVTRGLGSLQEELKSVLKVYTTQNEVGGPKTLFYTADNVLELFSDQNVPYFKKGILW